MEINIGSYSENYRYTMNRILNGYRFPAWIPKGLYDVYADWAYRTENPDEEQLLYLKLMKELNPKWKPKKKVKQKEVPIKIDKRMTEIYRYTLAYKPDGYWRSLKDAAINTNHTEEQIRKAIQNRRPLSKSYWSNKPLTQCDIYDRRKEVVHV